MALIISSVCHPRESLPTEATSVPLPELFFAGGSNSLRGFSINQAGPRDTTTGYPIGGQGLFVNNLELRTPPVALPVVGDNLGFVFFHDMGNVFDTANHIISGMLRIHQPSIAACSRRTATVPCNFSYNPQAIGMGLRYKTPVGPVRFDVGYNFNPTRYPIQENGYGANAKPASYQFLFQYWTDFLMKRVLHLTTCLAIVAVPMVPPSPGGRGHRWHSRHGESPASVPKRLGRGHLLRGFYAAEALRQVTQADRVKSLTTPH